MRAEDLTGRARLREAALDGFAARPGATMRSVAAQVWCLANQYASEVVSHIDYDFGSIVAFHRARVGQIDDVLVVLDEAAERLAAVGVRQWPRRFEPQWVRPAIEQGHTWLVYVDAQLAATVTLEWSDPLWDGDRGTAGYLHRLAVREPAVGLGSHLLGWAAREVDRHNRQLLRLDCVAGNRRLRDYYESHGFQHRGDVEVGGLPGQRDAASPRILLNRYELRVQSQARPGRRN